MGMAKTIEQKSNYVGFPKPGELIEITGAHGLEANDRAILNILYEHAFNCGNITDRDAEWELPLARLRSPKHKGNERVRESLFRLMNVTVGVPFTDEKTGEAKILITSLFEFFEVSTNESSTQATVRFGLPKKLRPVIARSARWGRIKAEIVCEMTSKYAIALYELVQLRANLDKCVDVFPLARFRDLLGVPPKTYERGNDFLRFVVEPAVLEVNGVSDMGVSIKVNRRNSRAPIESVSVAWWRKEGDEFLASMRERGRSKVGRMARLRNQVEVVQLVTQIDLESYISSQRIN